MFEEKPLQVYIERETFPRSFLFATNQSFQQRSIRYQKSPYWKLYFWQYATRKGIINFPRQSNLNYLYFILKYFIKTKNNLPREKKKKIRFSQKVIIVVISTKSNVVADRLGTFSSITMIEYHCQKPTIINKARE